MVDNGSENDWLHEYLVMDWLSPEQFGAIKALVGVAVQPPAPFLLLLIAVWFVRRRWVILSHLSLASLLVAWWLTSTTAFGHYSQTWLLGTPTPLGPDQFLQLRYEARGQPATGQTPAQAPIETAIVILGGGLEWHAPEYQGPNLTPNSLERLRYGAWLARKTGFPLAFAGGRGWAMGQQDPQGATGPLPTEAQVAQRILHEDYGQNFQWIDDQSRDTAENAQRIQAMLQASSITRVIVVTNGWHIPRAVRAFQRSPLDVVAAPMGMARHSESPLHDWLPSSRGILLNRHVWREAVALSVDGWMRDDAQDLKQ